MELKKNQFEIENRLSSGNMKIREYENQIAMLSQEVERLTTRIHEKSEEY